LRLFSERSAHLISWPGCSGVVTTPFKHSLSWIEAWWLPSHLTHLGLVCSFQSLRLVLSFQSWSFFSILVCNEGVVFPWLGGHLFINSSLFDLCYLVEFFANLAREGGVLRKGTNEVRSLFGTGSRKKRGRTNDFYSHATRLG
jgi:hypothetical protein